MNQIKINIILPFLSKKPGGGSKVMYEYAERLSWKGYDVCIYHSLKTSYTRRENTSKTGVVLEYLIKAIQGKRKSRPNWFTLNPRITSKRIPFVSDCWIRDAEICISTWWATAIDVSKLSLSKGRTINLIQDIETNMTNYPDRVFDSYRLNTLHVAISDFIRDTVKKYSSSEVELIFNGIDTNKYTLSNPVADRERYSVIMLYANHERKGSKFGIEALKELKNKYPELKVRLFTTELPESMPDLPDWIKVHFNPDNLIELYNQSAIFLSPSIQEGLALPPMEAMACGCACACTAIGGHQYLEDGVNSISFKPSSTEEIVTQISRFLDNDDFRQKIAENGHSYIQRYSWDRSVEKLEVLFQKLISDTKQ